MTVAVVLAALRKYLADVRAKSDAALFKIVCGRAAIIPSVLIGLYSGSLLSQYFVMTLAAMTLTPLAVLLAQLIWPKVEDWAQRSGNPYRAIQYLHDEYIRDKRLLDELPVSHSEKAQLYIARYEQFKIESEPFRKMILNRRMRLIEPI